MSGIDPPGRHRARGLTPVEPPGGDLRRYAQLLRRRWAWVVLGPTIAGALAIAYLALTPELYAATARVFVSAGGGVPDGVAGLQQAQYVQDRVRSYAEIANSPGVLEPVIEELDLNTTPQELSAGVRASTPLGTSLIDVTAESADAETSAAIANGAASQLAAVVVDLEKSAGQDEDPVELSVVRPAEVPAQRASPPADVIIALLAGLFGLVLGVVLAALREALDTTVNTGEEAVQASGGPLLGTIPADSATPKSPLLTDISSTSARAEAYKALRTNLRYTGVDERVRTVVLSSAAHGDGTTTTAANLALSLAQLGRQVLLLEGDLRAPYFATLFKLQEGPGLTDLLVGNATLEEVLQPFPQQPGLALLPAGQIPPNPSELLGSTHMAKLLQELQMTAGYDSVIIDAPPLLHVTDAVVLSEHVDGTMLVIGERRTNRDQIARARAALTAVDARFLGVVLNKAKSSYGAKKAYTGQARR